MQNNIQMSITLDASNIAQVEAAKAFLTALSCTSGGAAAPEAETPAKPAKKRVAKKPPAKVAEPEAETPEEAAEEPADEGPAAPTAKEVQAATTLKAGIFRAEIKAWFVDNGHKTLKAVPESEWPAYLEFLEGLKK